MLRYAALPLQTRSSSQEVCPYARQQAPLSTRCAQTDQVLFTGLSNSASSRASTDSDGSDAGVSTISPSPTRTKDDTSASITNSVVTKPAKQLQVQNDSSSADAAAPTLSDKDASSTVSTDDATTQSALTTKTPSRTDDSAQSASITVAPSQTNGKDVTLTLAPSGGSGFNTTSSTGDVSALAAAPEATSSPSAGGGVSKQAIMGVVYAGVCLFACVAIGGYLWWVRRKRERDSIMARHQLAEKVDRSETSEATLAVRTLSRIRSRVAQILGRRGAQSLL